MPLIFPSNTLSDAGYTVDNSCRFDDGNSPALTRTTEAPTDPDIYTFSVWVKRGNLGLANAKIFSVKTGSYGEEKLELKEDDLLWRKTDAGAGDTDYERQTDRVFRDPGAWYHILIAYDSSDGTPGDRMKMYINGVQQTSFSGSVNPDSSETSWLNTASLTLYIGAAASVTQYFDGYMAELAFVDGVAHAVTDFGEFDGDSPTIWKPKDISSGITWGNNGFYLDFEDSSALGNDVSGNNNDFSVSNLDATDQCTDSPTNNFCTMNPLDVFASAPLTEGNTVINAGGSDRSVRCTIGISKGLWYWEVNTTANNSANMGIINGYVALTDGNSQQTVSTNSVIWEGNGGLLFKNGSSVTTAYAGGTATYGFALDLDALTLKLSKDGVFFNSGAAVVTGITADTYFPFFAPNGGGSPTTFKTNFGNPAYAITSSNTDGNDYGNFEYAVPSSYYSLCTANLAEFG